MFLLEFFTSVSGRSPIKDYVSTLNLRTRDKIYKQFKHLREYGANRALLNSKKLIGSNIWEMRILGRDNIRILYSQANQYKIYILHIFNKKTQKLAKKEINLAVSRLKQMFDNDIL